MSPTLSQSDRRSKSYGNSSENVNVSDDSELAENSEQFAREEKLERNLGDITSVCANRINVCVFSEYAPVYTNTISFRIQIFPFWIAYSNCCVFGEYDTIVSSVFV